MRQVLFPDVEGFRPPDRQLPGIYRAVANRLAQGMDITAATSGGSAASSQLARSSEDYNTRYGGYMGYVLAWEVVKEVERFPADFSLAQMMNAEDRMSPSDVVEGLADRFLSVELEASARDRLIEFARSAAVGESSGQWGQDDERWLRELLHLLLSLPEYQLA